MLDIFNIAAALIFATTTILTTYKILSRIRRLKSFDLETLKLITRDIFVVVLGGFPIAFALLFRTLGIWESVALHPAWIIYSNISWVAIGLVFLYYEFFVIDK